MKLFLIVFICLIAILALANQGCTSDFDLVSCRDQIVKIAHEYDLKLEALDKTLEGKPDKATYKEYIKQRNALIIERDSLINNLECVKKKTP